MKVKTAILFLISVLCFSFAIYVYNRKDSLASKDSLKEQYFDKVQDNLDFHTSQLELESERAINYLESGNINDFTSDYAVFHVKNGTINHWTDYHIPYKPSFSSGVSKWKVTKTQQGVFLVLNVSNVSSNGVDQIISVIDLYREYNLSSSYLKSGYNKKIFEDYKIERKTILDKDGVILTAQGVPIWKIDLKIDDERLEWVVVVWLGALAVGFICFLWICVLWAHYFNKKNQLFYGFLIITACIIVVRLAMIYSRFPQLYFDFSLFDPTIFASSNFNPSFGDLFLNLMSLFIIFFYAYIALVKYNVYHWLLKLRASKTILFSYVFLALSFIAVWSLNHVFVSIYKNSIINFDITKSLHLDEPELIYIAIFTSIVAVYALINHFVLRALYVLYRKKVKTLLIHLSIATIIAMLLSLLDHEIRFVTLLNNTLYIAIIYSSLLFLDVRKLQYKTYLYLTFTSLVCSIVVATVLSEVSVQKDLRDRERFADQLLLHSDLGISYLMTQVGNQIKNDSKISQNIGNGFTPKESIESRIRGKYFNSDFEEYDIHFSYFNKKGNGYYNNRIKGKLDDWVEVIQLDKYVTEEPNIYYVTDLKKEFYGTYYQFLKIKNRFGDPQGTIIVSYTLKRYIAKSILPGLLRLSSKFGYSNLENVNYAIFDKGILQYSVGDFNYSSDYFRPYLEDEGNYKKNFIHENYYHYIEKGIDQKIVVVSTEDSSWLRVITNFSFHFLILILIGLVFLIVKALLEFKTNSTSDFSTKIQTYLNIATFAPMLMLSIFILGLISSSYKSDQELAYQNSSEILSSHVFDYLDSYLEDEVDFYDLKKSIGKLSKYSGSDINLYNKEGALMLSSQPLLYEAGVVSNLINPEARTKLFGMKKRILLVEESIGDFLHSTVYVGLYNPEDSEFLGVMSVPFFNSSYQIEQKKISALMIIINVFAIAFILLLVTSYFVTKGLTSPLKLIANKLRKVETGHENEPLYWGANDELGLLIDEYNQMLVKIEESKKTIIQTEKELAWKEMAKQVAHEIKNPLTPMKLKLQHLKRVISSDDDRTSTAIDSLLEQVETMDEIATSFSSFAKMPAPEVERINLSEVVSIASSLYQNNTNYDVILDLEDNLYVNGDGKLIGRILSNLILNGVQAVTSDIRPVVSVKLKVDHNNPKNVELSVTDNGDGIPEEIQKKVFIPNFTTKYSGSGIGLAVAKNGIEQMGGQIWFETGTKKGTTFFITLERA